MIAFNKSKTGTKHTQETIEKMRQAGKVRTGALNGRFGTKWMYNPSTLESCCVKVDGFERFQKEGWVFGRTFKKGENDEDSFRCKSNQGL